MAGTPQYVSEFTQKTLSQFGWQANDPLPENMGELIADIRERTPPSKVPGLLVNIQDMAADDVAAVRAALEQTKTVVETEKKQAMLERQTAGLHDSAKQIYAQLSEKEPQIIDDRKAAPAPAPVEPPKPAETEPAKVNLADPLTEPPEKLVEAPEEEKTPPFCPRCSWDMRLQFDVEATEHDKESFVAVTLGNERFKKTFELMGGKYKVRFRSLLAEENNVIHHQLLLDQRDNHFLSDTEWFLRMFEYRMACSIEEIYVNDKLVAAIPELDAVSAQMQLPNKADNPEKPAVVRLREYALVDVLRNEITRRLVGNQFRQFQRLYETLEAMALEPNFW